MSVPADNLAAATTIRPFQVGFPDEDLVARLIRAAARVGARA